MKLTGSGNINRNTVPQLVSCLEFSWHHIDCSNKFSILSNPVANMFLQTLPGVSGGNLLSDLFQIIMNEIPKKYDAASEDSIDIMDEIVISETSPKEFKLEFQSSCYRYVSYHIWTGLKVSCDGYPTIKFVTDLTKQYPNSWRSGSKIGNKCPMPVVPVEVSVWKAWGRETALPQDTGRTHEQRQPTNQSRFSLRLSAQLELFHKPVEAYLLFSSNRFQEKNPCSAYSTLTCVLGFVDVQAIILQSLAL